MGCPCNDNENIVKGGSSCKKGGFNYRTKSKSKSKSKNRSYKKKGGSSCKKGGFNYRSKSKSKSKSKKSKRRGGMKLSHIVPLNKDPTTIGRPIKGGSLIGNPIGSPFSNTGNTGTMGSYNTLNAQSGGNNSDVTNQNLKNNSPMV